MLSTVTISIEEARGVADFLTRITAMTDPGAKVILLVQPEETKQIEGVRDALYALSNDTDAIVTDPELFK
jgi:hypothetical protein